jgi:hypothetical protein
MVRVFSRGVGTTTYVGRIVAGLSVFSMLVLAGCASVPPPDNAMNLAQSQLQAARDARAADYAPVDLGFAQDKFQQAQGAMAERKYADAATLAAEAKADAELAAAKGRLGAARAQIEQKIADNNRLRRPAGPASDQGAAPAREPLPDDNRAPPIAALPDLPAGAASAGAAGSDQGQPTQGTPTPPSAGFQTVPPPVSGSQPAQAQSVPAAPTSAAGQIQGVRP